MLEVESLARLKGDRLAVPRSSPSASRRVVCARRRAQRVGKTSLLRILVTACAPEVGRSAGAASRSAARARGLPLGDPFYFGHAAASMTPQPAGEPARLPLPSPAPVRGHAARALVSASASPARLDDAGAQPQEPAPPRQPGTAVPGPNAQRAVDSGRALHRARRACGRRSTPPRSQHCRSGRHGDLPPWDAPASRARRVIDGIRTCWAPSSPMLRRDLLLAWRGRAVRARLARLLHHRGACSPSASSARHPAARDRAKRAVGHPALLARLLCCIA